MPQALILAIKVSC